MTGCHDECECRGDEPSDETKVGHRGGYLVLDSLDGPPGGERGSDRVYARCHQAWLLDEVEQRPPWLDRDGIGRVDADGEERAQRRYTTGYVAQCGPVLGYVTAHRDAPIGSRLGSAGAGTSGLTNRPSRSPKIRPVVVQMAPQICWSPASSRCAGSPTGSRSACRPCTPGWATAPYQPAAAPQLAGASPSTQTPKPPAVTD